jgi:hypothetical protein
MLPKCGFPRHRVSTSRLETILRALGAAFIFVLVASPTISFAQYLYLEGDPRVVQEHLIVDMQDGRVDPRNLSPTALQTLRSLSNNTMSFPALSGLGKLKSVCHTLVVQFPKGRNLAFRANHEGGTMDWVVTISYEPEQVQNLVFLASKGSGPPAVLPYVTGDGKILPSVALDYGEAFVRPATNEELAIACQRYPRMC